AADQCSIQRGHVLGRVHAHGPEPTFCSGNPCRRPFASLARPTYSLRKAGERMSGEDPKRDAGALSQWELVFLRFKRHRLAVASFYIIVVLYLLAIFCEFFSAVQPATRRLDATY